MDLKKCVKDLQTFISNDPNYAKTKEFQVSIAALIAEEVKNFGEGNKYSFSKKAVIPYKGAQHVNELLDTYSIEETSFINRLSSLYKNISKNERENLLKELYEGKNLEALKEDQCLTINAIREEQGFADNDEVCFIHCITINLVSDLEM